MRQDMRRAHHEAADIATDINSSGVGHAFLAGPLGAVLMYMPIAQVPKRHAQRHLGARHVHAAVAARRAALEPTPALRPTPEGTRLDGWFVASQGIDTGGLAPCVI